MRPGFTIIGIDPGLEGALAFYAPEAPRIITVDDMPTAGKDIDPAALARRIRQIRPDIAIIERVGSRPGQGVASMFRFGAGYGMVQGVIAALQIPVHFVTPAKWKQHFRLSAEKEEARARAVQLWPSSDRFTRKKDAGRAEACLIARYAAETFPDITGSATRLDGEERLSPTRRRHFHRLRGGWHEFTEGDRGADIVGTACHPVSAPAAPGLSGVGSSRKREDDGNQPQGFETDNELHPSPYARLRAGEGREDDVCQ